jgi:hypothetical protein
MEGQDLSLALVLTINDLRILLVQPVRRCRIAIES